MELLKKKVCVFTNQTIALEGIVSLLNTKKNSLQIWTAKHADISSDFFNSQDFLDTDYIITAFNTEKIELLQQYKNVSKQKQIIVYCDHLNLETLERVNNYQIDYTISSISPIDHLLAILTPKETKVKKIRTNRIDYNRLLSKREIEIIHFIKKGYQIKEISDNLQLSNRTIGKHRENIYKKLKVHSVVELLAKVKVLK